MTHEERRAEALRIALHLGQPYHHGSLDKMVEMAERFDKFMLDGKPKETAPKATRAPRK